MNAKIPITPPAVNLSLLKTSVNIATRLKAMESKSWTPYRLPALMETATKKVIPHG